LSGRKKNKKKLKISRGQALVNHCMRKIIKTHPSEWLKTSSSLFVLIL